jgi:hypothetical protein
MIAALFVRADSHYKGMPGVDAWDMDRDARRYDGELPVVAHPPCRAWGRLRQFAKPRPDEKALAIFAVEKVRQLGGVLEHPEHSTLWKEAGLPLPGKGVDQFGGWTLPIDQFWFGHLARKRTWLYIVGTAPAELPPIPMRFGHPTHVVRYHDNARRKELGLKILGKADREHTPTEFASWLVELAKRCRK